MNSVRLPRKMIVDVHNVPLVIRTARQALKSRAAKVIVATDDEIIKDLCEKYGIQSIMTSSEHQSGTDRLCESVHLLSLSNKEEIIVNVQGDELFIDPSIINELADFISMNRSDVATVAHTITDEKDISNPNVVKVVLDSSSHALYFSRAPIPFSRDGFPFVSNYLKHIGIYAYTVKFLENYSKLSACALESIERLEQLRILYNGFKISVLTSEINHETGVDTMDDLNRARHKLMQENNIL